MSCECTDNIIIPYVKPEDIVAIPVETPVTHEYNQAVQQAKSYADQAAAAGPASVAQINTAKTTAITAISSAKTESITAIQEQGATTLASIPADYSALSGQIAKKASYADENNLAKYGADLVSNSATITVPSNVGSVEVAKLGGHSFVWNQLANHQVIAYNGDGQYSDGIITFTTHNYAGNAISIPIGHKILCKATMRKDASDTNGYGIILGVVKTSGSWFTYDIKTASTDWQNLCFVDTITQDVNAFNVGRNSGSSSKYYVKNVFCVDLTLLYGETYCNAHTNDELKAKFEADFPADYYAYNAGEIISQKADIVKSVGKNLFNPQIVGQGSGNSRATEQTLSNGKRIKATQNNYDCMRYSVPCKPNTKYSFSCGTKQSNAGMGHPRVYIIGVDANGNDVSELYNEMDGRTIQSIFTTQANNVSISVMLYSAWTTVSIGQYTDYIDIMLCETDGNTIIPYSPYQEQSFTIGTDCASVVGRGLSCGDLVNITDLRNGRQDNVVAEVDMGTLEWNQDSVGKYYTNVISTIKKVGGWSAKANVLCAKYTTDSYNNINNGVDKILAIDNLGRVWVNDSAYTDASAFKTAMSGVKLIYELATPTSTDISSYITPANTILDAEEGGTISLIDNAHTDMHVDIPSTLVKRTWVAGQTLKNQRNIDDIKTAILALSE